MDRRRRLTYGTRIKFPRVLTTSVELVAVGALLVATFSIFMVVRGGRRSSLDHQQSNSCQFPAIYNFGDSNSDTGAVCSTFGRRPPPYGNTFFHKPSGRHTDGRVIIDFLAERLGLPYLSAYLDSLGTSFRHGANFAASGSTIQPANAIMLNRTFNPLTLDVQFLQFEQFKARSSDLYHEAKTSDVKERLPRPEDFSRALYTLDIGQNDLHAGIVSMKEEQVKAYIPSIIKIFASVIKKLHQEGARTFWIHNTGPIGCLPFFVANYPPSPSNTDQIGCVKSYNELAQEFNKQLKQTVLKLKKQLQETSFIYVDIYSMKYSLISEAKNHGFTDPLGQCCGRNGNLRVKCGAKAMVNGTEVYGASCSNPLEYISWDGIHYTEAASRWVANRIQDGSVSDPQLPITEACKAVSSSNLHQ